MFYFIYSQKIKIRKGIPKAMQVQFAKLHRVPKRAYYLKVNKIKLKKIRKGQFSQ